MVRFFESLYDYDYPFSAVSLAYFLRYPNPKARHVLSTDVIDRDFDPNTQRLTTTRLHLKKSKIPAGILKLLPKSVLGRGGASRQSYVVEHSVVDIAEGWMQTDSRNLEWTGVLSVIEKQTYHRPAISHDLTAMGRSDWAEATKGEGTQVTASVTLLSRLGQGRATRKLDDPASADQMTPTRVAEEDARPKRGWFKSLSTSGIQRSIEMIGLRRTREAIHNGTDGMNIVLDRLRRGGLVRVLEGMRQDGQLAFGASASEE